MISSLSSGFKAFHALKYPQAFVLQLYSRAAVIFGGNSLLCCNGQENYWSQQWVKGICDGLCCSLASLHTGTALTTHLCSSLKAGCSSLPSQDPNSEAGMLRKMEKRGLEETSLLEFIKSKVLALRGEGEWAESTTSHFHAYLRCAGWRCQLRHLQGCRVLP